VKEIPGSTISCPTKNQQSGATSMNGLAELISETESHHNNSSSSSSIDCLSRKKGKLINQTELSFNVTPINLYELHNLMAREENNRKRFFAI